MKLDHIALYVHDLEGARNFFTEFFGTKSNDMYHNHTTGLQTYFLSFPDSGRIEIMSRPEITASNDSIYNHGLNHIAINVGSTADVDRLTEKLRNAGYTVISGPRTTGDGYYESCIQAFEGCLIELLP